MPNIWIPAGRKKSGSRYFKIVKSIHPAKVPPPAAAKRVKNVVRRVLSRSKERDFYTSPVAAQEITTTDYILDMSTISQGNTISTRHGDIVEGIHVDLRLNIERKATATTRMYTRCMIIRWKPDTAVETPTFTKVLEEGATYPNFSALVQDPTARGKYEVLYDRNFAMPVPNLGGADVVQIYRKLSLKGKKIYFNDTATTGRGHIYLMVVGNVASGTNTATFYSRSLIKYRE